LFAGHAWRQAYAALATADESGELDGSELELLASTAFLIGRDQAGESALSRAHKAHASVGDFEGAARAACHLGFRLMWREPAHANGWLGRAARTLEDAGCDECAVHGYLMLFAGPVGAAEFTNYTRTSDYTWSSGIYATDPTYTYIYDKYGAVAKSPVFGIRVGSQINAFAVDGELSYGKWASTNDPVTGHFTNFYYDYYGYQHKSNTSATFTPVEGWLVASSINIGMNMYAIYPGKVLQPYIGIGGLMGIVTVSSESPNHVGINDEPLNATTLGFTFQVPIGLKVLTGKSFFLWAEWRPVWEFMLDYKTGPSGYESSDSFRIHPTEGLFGIGFFFN